MNHARPILLTAYLVGVVVLCLWVPWRAVAPGVIGGSFYVGYGLLWKGPTVRHGRPGERSMYQVGAVVDKERWVGTLLALSAIAGIGLTLTGNSKC